MSTYLNSTSRIVYKHTTPLAYNEAMFSRTIAHIYVDIPLSTLNLSNGIRMRPIANLPAVDSREG